MAARVGGGAAGTGAVLYEGPALVIGCGRFAGGYNWPGPRTAESGPCKRSHPSFQSAQPHPCEVKANASVKRARALAIQQPVPHVACKSLLRMATAAAAACCVTMLRSASCQRAGGHAMQPHGKLPLHANAGLAGLACMRWAGSAAAAGKDGVAACCEGLGGSGGCSSRLASGCWGVRGARAPGLARDAGVVASMPGRREAASGAVRWGPVLAGLACSSAKPLAVGCCSCCMPHSPSQQACWAGGPVLSLQLASKTCSSSRDEMRPALLLLTLLLLLRSAAKPSCKAAVSARHKLPWISNVVASRATLGS